MFNREFLTQALLAVLLLNLSIMGYQYFAGSSSEMRVIEPMPAELLVKAPTLGKNKHIKVETDLLTLYIDKQGGRISKAVVSGADSAFFDTDANGYLDAQTGFSGDAQLMFSAAKSQYRLQGDTLTVLLSAQDKNGVVYQKQFDFTKGSYAIGVKSMVQNSSNQDMLVQSYHVIGGEKLTPKEKKAPSVNDFSLNSSEESTPRFSRSYSGVSFSSTKKPYVRMKFPKMKGSDSWRTKGGWVAFQKQYYIAAWVLDKDTSYRVDNFWRDGLSAKNKDKYEQQFATQALSAARKLAPGEKIAMSSTLYVGEQSLPKMMAVEPSLRLTMDYGFFWMVANTLHRLTAFVHEFVPSWSLSLILLVAFFRLLLLRLSKDQAEHMKKIKALQPEKEIIEKRYEHDKWNPAKYEALSALHKKHGLSGFPLAMLTPFFHIPLMIGFFSMVQVAVEFKSEPFLWIPNMAAKDPYYILPVLGAIMAFMHFQLQQEMNMQEEFKVVFKILPFVVLFLSVNWPAITCLYMVVNTSLFVIQDKLLNKK